MGVKRKKGRLVDVFARNVRARRTEQRLSQEQLAERAGVHRTYVGMNPALGKERDDLQR